MKILIRYLRPYWPYVLAIFGLLGLRATSELFLPYLMADIVNNGVATANVGYILKVGLKMICITIVGMGANLFVVYVASLVALRLCTNLRSKIFEKILSFSSHEVDDFGVASLITRTTNDIMQVQNFTVMFLRLALYSPIMAIGGFFMVLSTNQNMSYIIVIAVIALFCVIGVISVIIIPKFKLQQSLVDETNEVSREMLSGILVVRAFDRETKMEEKFDQTNKKLNNTALFINRTSSFMFPLMSLIMNFTTVAIIFIGARQISNGSIEVGDMMAFIQYAMLIIMSFLLFSMMFIMMPRAIVSAKRIEDVLTTPLSIVPTEKTTGFKSEDGTIEFKNVEFKYPNAEESVLKNINFVAKRGETTAFIGSTGSGKSTLINLLPRFYDATAGSIMVDGVNIKDVDQKELNKKIGFVPQKGILFGGTIKSNIIYGDPQNISEEQMIKAAKIAQAFDFIDKKELKFDDPISQGGTNVSGGQRQRLSIARALAIDPEILVFDDSFSALDYKTDRELRKKISEELYGKTILIVAQRINTIRNADKIIVLENGAIVGSGTHDQLMKSCNVYIEIANSQLSKEELAHA